MKKLNWELVDHDQLPTSHIDSRSLPEKVLQFGEGNFLRGFVDWMIHELNKNHLFNGRIVAIQPTPHGKVVPKLNAQDGLYTVALRGVQNGETIDKKEVVSSISRGINPYTDWERVLKVAANPNIEVVFSNTTESGLKYIQENFYAGQSPDSFPAKLTACMFHRYQVHDGNPNMGWIIIPCELIENNGDVLKDLVLKITEEWKLPEPFKDWVINCNYFYNTLVDRIVTGYPRNDIETFQKEIGYVDELLTVGEPYHLFVLEGHKIAQEKLPFQKAGLHVHWGDVALYRELKVKILNGAHTLMCSTGFLSGKATVQDVMNDPRMEAFAKKAIYEEILPVVDCPDEQKLEFARSVLDRFRNPFNPHRLLDISLNSISKFRSRLLPTIFAYAERFQALPPAISCSLAFLIYFYKSVRMEGRQFYGMSGQEEYKLQDDEEVLQFFYHTWNSTKNHSAIENLSTTKNLTTVVDDILSSENLWGSNLLEVPELKHQVLFYLEKLAANQSDILPA